MRSILLFVIVAGSALGAASTFTSCTTKRSTVGPEGYTPPPSLSPVDATERMRQTYRDEFR